MQRSPDTWPFATLAALTRTAPGVRREWQNSIGDQPDCRRSGFQMRDRVSPQSKRPRTIHTREGLGKVVERKANVRWPVYRRLGFCAAASHSRKVGPAVLCPDLLAP